MIPEGRPHLLARGVVNLLKDRPTRNQYSKQETVQGRRFFVHVLRQHLPLESGDIEAEVFKGRLEETIAYTTLSVHEFDEEDSRFTVVIQFESRIRSSTCPQCGTSVRGSGIKVQCPNCGIQPCNRC